MSSPRTVVSLGGNAILPAGGPGRIEEQFRVTLQSMEQVVRLIRSGEEVVITHGNGPIVGNILLRNEAAADMIPPTPLYICGADSQGGIGFMIQQVLGNLLRSKGIPRPVATVVTQVVVDPEDPAFQEPTKPIGPPFEEGEARRLMRERGWRMREDAGRGWRRVVPSPEPKRIVEAETVRLLVESGCVVIAAGGGGVPVCENADGALRGVEAVVDKDLASVVLAGAVGASRLIIITAVDAVALDYGKPTQRPIERMSVEEAKRYLEEGQFPPGNMGPKVLGAVRFIEQGGSEVLITSVGALGDALAGRGGTRILPV